MFEGWRAEVYRPVDRAVLVQTTTLWVDAGPYSMGLPPRVAREHGLRFRYPHPGRQRAWVRRDNGQWLALIEVDVKTADGANTVTLQLWLQSHQFTLPRNPDHTGYRAK
ncbi:hypothetical protein [Mycolicibacterium aubagnense]|uniref:Transposase n=1 Tax=Mycolicibacterium aubagnense TaxID=319707 RepID=A0ABN5Z3L2_9MYCO|nr:hypothetical protein [Mycolicibacterium aubagnense]TLH64225.1 hypothetical protein C1S80_12455 [Mycolicibacterium aubagnense]WGI30801.1 hypothetical protein QDT91_16050 [Mycolicibacterium aubagnense]BBX87862.1 hypothetical protein MAUB_57350 [Mycolicibacterium aubagnense]